MLRVRTGYSFRAATGHPEEVLSRIKDHDCLALDGVAPITDRASTFGWARWTKLSKAMGLRPVYGVELAVTPSVHAPKPSVDYWMFIARGDVSKINRLVELATTHFRYQPLLTIDEALGASRTCSVIMGHRPQIDWKRNVPKNVYLGLSPAVTKGLLRNAVENGWPLAATGDNVFTAPEDRALYETLVGRGARLQTYPQHLVTRDEWRASIAHLGLSPAELNKAIANSAGILKAGKAELLRASLPEPIRPATLKVMCEKAAKRLGVNLKDKVYRDRLNKELQLIASKGYEDYFYIVADLCQWARKKMLVGPARGSSCGSLVCYLLEITTVDPIPHGLIFERFVDINRTDMPDIDIDFSDQQRHKVFEYLTTTYGEERVARLGVTTTYLPRSALREVGAALRLPIGVTSKLADSLIERSSGDSRALQTLEDTIDSTPIGRMFRKNHPEAMLVTRFEGHPRHYSQHAAGVVIASEPISKYVAIDRRTGATMCDKEDAEAFNLLKIDALGLTQLSVFEDCLELIGKPRDFLFKLPLNDRPAFQVINDKRYAGIFQFNGLALQNIVREFEVTRFDDIVSVTALARPGPLASGGAAEWVARKNGRKPITYPHPLFEPYLKDTLGIVLYQEQVMEIGRNIGDLDWGQVTALRKAMSKSLGKEYFDQFGEPWKAAAIKKGVDPIQAAKVWDELCAYGAWSFNKSHSVAYGLISYWCAWLKAHYLYEFAAATLSHEKLADQQLKLLRELVNEGARYQPVDIDLSTDKWTIKTEHNNRQILVGPLDTVKGIGPSHMASILEARRKRTPMPDRTRKMLEKPVTAIDSLYPIRDAFRRIMPDPTEKNIYTLPIPIANLKPDRKEQKVVIFCTLTKINPRDLNEPIAIQKRGYEIKEGRPTAWLQITFSDDTGHVRGSIGVHDWEKLKAQQVIERGRPGKCLYAVQALIRAQGSTSGMDIWLNVTQMRYIGDIDDDRPNTQGNSVVRTDAEHQDTEVPSGQDASCVA
jgi:DNA polymerase III alpha subunit